MAVQAFSLASNWDTELARLRMLTLDGPEAVAALHPPYPRHQAVSDRPLQEAGRVVDALHDDLARADELFTAGGGSNNWAISGEHTKSGSPILANDPHLAPLLPPHWYLAHLETPEWSIVGGSIPGTPAFGFGHNGHGAWGITAGLIDNTDLFLEEIGPDGRSVRRGETFVDCAVRRETINVQGDDSITIEVLETDRGPIVGPAFEGEFGAISMSATWFEAGDLGAVLDVGRFRSFDDLHEGFRGWSSVPLNVAYADATGTVGWQLIGSAPQRGTSSGTMPADASDPDTAWRSDPVPYDEMPNITDPQPGFVATANNLPSTDGPYLGSDFLDGYRLERISRRLSEHSSWTVAETLALQMDRLNLPWMEIKPVVLDAAAHAGDLGVGVNLLRDWDGRMESDSPEASLFAAFIAELSRLIAESRAPQSSKWALGTGFTPLVPFNSLLVRRTSHLVGLLGTRPDGWFEDGWDDAIRRAFRSALAMLTESGGRDPRGWKWGEIRALTLVHPMGLRPPLDRIWNIGPIPHGGDANTVNPGPVDPLDPFGNPSFAIASGRMVVEIGEWDSARFCLPGGQSGNPYSRHYRDQVQMWLEGDALMIPTSTRAVDRSVRRRRTLTPTP
jgi:penicillin amidase